MLQLKFTEVIDVVTTIATSVATVVTVASLVQSKKQFLLNMKEQKRGMDIALFDERTSILEQIKSNDFSFSKERFYLLFPDNLTDQLNRYYSLNEDKEHLEEIMSNFIARLVSLKSKDNLNAMGYQSDYYDDYYKELMKYLKDREKNASMKDDLNEPILAFGSEENAISYSYIDLDDKRGKIEQEIEMVHKNLVDAIAAYIKNSIS